MNLELHFKNVGQGDTIVIHWESNSFFGLVDCNQVDNNIDYLITHINSYKIKVFEFVILSHPHYDHFSGFTKLFEYCQKANISIKKFIHTAAFHPLRLQQIFAITPSSHKNLILSPVNRVKTKKNLWEFYVKLDEQKKLKSKGFIKDMQVVSNDYCVIRNDFFSIKFLAPFQLQECDEYIRSFNKRSKSDALPEAIEFPDNNPKANLLSSFLQISGKVNEWQFLLMSDVTKFCLKRIFTTETYFAEIKKTKLLGAQIPHHGSIENHEENFWNNIANSSNAHYLVSVGPLYGHPNVKVVGYFHRKSEKIHSTNCVGGYKDYFSKAIIPNLINETDLFLNMPGILPIEVNNSYANSKKCGPKIVRITEEKGEVLCEVENGT